MDILLSGKYRGLVISNTVLVAGLLGLLYTHSSLASTNQAPTALAQTVTTKEDTKKSITLHGTDPERKKLTYVIVKQPARGTITLKSNNVTYVPAQNYFGQDAFSFKVNDGVQDSAPANVNLTITPVNDKPVAENGSANALRNTAREITLKATDVDGDPLTYLPAKKSKKGGIVTVKAGNTVIYTPKKDYVGADSFTFTAQDNQKGKSTTATVNVTVEAAPNRPPVVNAGTDQQVDTGKTVTLNGSGSDPDNDTLSYSWKQTAGVPTVVLTKANSATASFTAPSVTANTKLTFALTVTDGRGGVVTDTVDVTVKPANRPPVANAGVDQQALSASVVKLQGSGSDPDNDPLTYSWTQTSGTPVVSLTNANSATPSFTAPAISSDTTLTFTLTVNDGRGGKATDTVNILIASKPVVIHPSPTGKLNDTGIVQCNAHLATSFTCPKPSFPGQDAESGRDANSATNNDYDGHRGFSFTKIGKDGKSLPKSATQWSCVKDNVTGLIWEVKTDDGGLHDKDWTYTWFDTNPVANLGDAGVSNGGACGKTSRCDTSGFVEAVNKSKLCGAGGWRMPTIEELISIVDYSKTSTSAIDLAYFPHSSADDYYWSGMSSSGGLYARYVSYGADSNYGKFNTFKVRLVRSQ